MEDSPLVAALDSLQDLEEEPPGLGLAQALPLRDVVEEVLEEQKKSIGGSFSPLMRFVLYFLSFNLPNVYNFF